MRLIGVLAAFVALSCPVLATAQTNVVSQPVSGPGFLGLSRDYLSELRAAEKTSGSKAVAEIALDAAAEIGTRLTHIPGSGLSEIDSSGYFLLSFVGRNGDGVETLTSVPVHDPLLKEPRLPGLGPRQRVLEFFLSDDERANFGSVLVSKKKLEQDPVGLESAITKLASIVLPSSVGLKPFADPIQPPKPPRTLIATSENAKEETNRWRKQYGLGPYALIVTLRSLAVPESNAALTLTQVVRFEQPISRTVAHLQNRLLVDQPSDEMRTRATEAAIAALTSCTKTYAGCIEGATKAISNLTGSWISQPIKLSAIVDELTADLAGTRSLVQDTVEIENVKSAPLEFGLMSSAVVGSSKATLPRAAVGSTGYVPQPLSRVASAIVATGRVPLKGWPDNLRLGAGVMVTPAVGPALVGSYQIYKRFAVAVGFSRVYFDAMPSGEAFLNPPSSDARKLEPLTSGRQYLWTLGMIVSLK